MRLGKHSLLISHFHEKDTCLAPSFNLSHKIPPISRSFLAKFSKLKKKKEITIRCGNPTFLFFISHKNVQLFFILILPLSLSPLFILFHFPFLTGSQSFFLVAFLNSPTLSFSDLLSFLFYFLTERSRPQVSQGCRKAFFRFLCGLLTNPFLQFSSFSCIFCSKLSRTWRIYSG